MVRNIHTALLAATVAFAAGGSAFAADLYEPPVVIDTPPIINDYPQVVDHGGGIGGGWYLRGDVDYHWSRLKGTEYTTYGVPGGSSQFATTKLKEAWSIGGGIGYRINSHLRTDVTVDWMSKSNFTGSTVGVCGGLPCTSSDVGGYSALVLLANAYVDLGTYSGITPYVGAGVGGARVAWNDLENTVGGVTTRHRGTASARFAYALMAGASYCVNDKLDVDVGYRFMDTSGGRMFEYAPAAGPGYDKGLQTHEVRAGLRWKLGNEGKGCGGTKTVSYTPVMPPVYK
jgi:opacity protein-like surface antigen